MVRRETDRRRSCGWRGRVSCRDIAGDHLGCILLKMAAVSFVVDRRDGHVVHERNPHEHLISLRSGCCVAQMTSRNEFVRAGAVLRSEQQRHLERPALHGGGHPPHRSQRPNRPLLHVRTYSAQHSSRSCHLSHFPILIMNKNVVRVPIQRREMFS